jgi:hypothetical protein
VTPTCASSRGDFSIFDLTPVPSVRADIVHLVAIRRSYYLRCSRDKDVTAHAHQGTRRVPTSSLQWRFEAAVAKLQRTRDILIGLLIRG